MMIDDGSSMLQVAQSVALFPALAIIVIILGFSIGGDGLRDALVTRLRERLSRRDAARKVSHRGEQNDPDGVVQLGLSPAPRVRRCATGGD